MQVLVNYYACDNCEHWWVDCYECMVDDECPECGSGPYQPYRSLDAQTAIDAEALLAEAKRLIEEAVETHIYDFENGDEPGEDCGYMRWLKEYDKHLTGEGK